MVNCKEKCLESMEARYGFFASSERVEKFCERVCNNVRLHWSGPVHGEDALLFHVLPVLMDIHGKDNYWFKSCFRDIDVYFHRRINNVEIDVMITFIKEVHKPRLYRIILELKETDLAKLVEQLLVRRKYGTWAYGVISLHPNTVLRMLMSNPDRLRVLVDYGIGIIALYGEIPVVILESVRRKTPGTLEDILDKILEPFKEKQ